MMRKIIDWLKYRHEKPRELVVLTELGMPPFWICDPRIIFPGTTGWYIWGRMQARMISEFRRCWGDARVYIRLETPIGDHFVDILRPCEYAMVTDRGNYTIFTLRECDDECLWTSILASAPLVPRAKSVFILDRSPADWQSTVARLFDATQSLEKGPPNDRIAEELEMCHCVCLSMDWDLLIAKIDLPDATVLSILGDVARDEGLELVLR